MKMMSKMMCMAVGTMLTAGMAMGQANHVTISQVYGGGGNSGAPLNADFLELFNPTSAPVSIGGWAVQYASSTGNFNASSNKIDIPSGATIAPNSYFLIKLSSAGATGSALPTPDLDSSSISAGATSGKIVLINNNTYITNGATGNCPTATNIVDFVGFGTAATCSEGTPTANLGNALAAFRGSGGCVDTNNNGADFTVAAPAPRNSASPTNVCQSAQPPSGSGSANPTNGCPNSSVTFTFTVTPGVPANPIATVTADASSIGAGTLNFTNSGGNTWTANATIDINTTPGSKTLPVTITESAASGGRTGAGSLSVTVNNCTFGLTTGTGVSPSVICAGSDITFTAVVRKNTINPPGTSTGVAVTLDLAPLGGANGTAMTDLGDDAGNPNLRNFTYTFTTAPSLFPGGYFVQIHATDQQGSNPTLNPFNVNITNCTPATSDVVISQVYGGGGATVNQATFKDDYVELFNRSSASVTMTGWTVQYASASGPTGTNPWNVSGSFSGTIPSGGYYLVRMSTGGAGINGAALPIAPDFDSTSPQIGISASAGKIALVSDATALTGAMPTGGSIKDLVGYGSADFFEGGAAAPGLDALGADFRRLNGCQDYDQNGADFFVGTPSPRNSASALNSCFGIPSGKCCATAGTCTISVQADCASPSVWTLNGVCSPNTCPQPASGVCCRGATCTTALTSAAACSGGLVGSPTAGAFFVSSSTTCNASATVNTPCCYADYNKLGGISVQDIFDFLSDWFAGFPYANTGGNGTPGVLSVQNIFDFLSDWFAGGC